MPYIEVEPDVHLFYEIRGSGKTILFVHGWTMSHDVWEYQVAALANRYQTVVLDLRGNGDSDKPWGDYGYDTYVRDLRTVIHKLKLKDVTLVGWSLGGAIGVQYLSAHGDGVSRFVSVDGAVPVFVQTAALPYGPTREMVDKWILEERTRRPDFTKEFVDSMFYESQDTYTKLWIWDICMKTSWHVAIQSLITLRDTEVTKLLPAIRVPTAIFHGAHDRVVPYDLGKYTASKIPKAKLVTFANSGHAPFIEENERFTEELVRFIEQSKAAPSKTHWFIR